jgi:membrane protease YdiL (CAAX protease family)
MSASLRQGLKHIGAFLLLFLAILFANSIWGIAWSAVGKALGLPKVLADTLAQLGALALDVWLVWWALRRFEKLDMGETALPRHHGWMRDLVLGQLIGAVTMAIILVLYWASNWIEIEGWVIQAKPQGEWWTRLWLSLITGVGSALLGCVVIQGYLFAVLDRQWGFWPAALVASALMSVSLMVFGIANNVPWWASLGGGLLLGTMLCWQYWRSGALWLSIGVLSAWNVSNLDLFNLAGNNDNPNLWGAYTTLSGPLALQGAAKGVETILSTLVAAAIALTGSWLLLRKRNLQRPWRTPE